MNISYGKDVYVMRWLLFAHQKKQKDTFRLHLKYCAPSTVMIGVCHIFWEIYAIFGLVG